MYTTILRQKAFHNFDEFCCDCETAPLTILTVNVMFADFLLLHLF